MELVLGASLPFAWLIIGWLWRAGRLSDRTTAIAVVASIPVFVFVVLIIGGVSPVVSAAVTLIPALVAGVMYPVVLPMLSEHVATVRALNATPESTDSGIPKSARVLVAIVALVPGVLLLVILALLLFGRA